MLHNGHYFCYLIFLTLRYPTSYIGYRNLRKTDTWFLSLGVLSRTFDHFMTKWPFEDFKNQKYKTHLHALVFSDFVKGESWDSSSEKWVPVNESEIENTLGLYVTRQLVWRQSPKICTSVQDGVKCLTWTLLSFSLLHFFFLSYFMKSRVPVCRFCFKTIIFLYYRKERGSTKWLTGTFQTSTSGSKCKSNQTLLTRGYHWLRIRVIVTYGKLSKQNWVEKSPVSWPKCPG